MPCVVRAGLLCILLAASLTTAFAQFPKPSGYVNDFAGVMSAPTRDELEALLRDLEQQTTAEIAVVTVNTLAGMSIEDYATGLFNTWGIGQEKVNNGVLVLVAPRDRAMRIEVGYGLETIIPDALAARIISENMAPYFSQNKYDLGIQLGVRRVAALLRQNQQYRPPRVGRSFASEFTSNGIPWRGVGIFVVLLITTTIGSAMIGGGILQRSFKVPFIGVLVAGVPFLLIPFFSPSLWWLPFAFLLLLWSLFTINATRKPAPPKVETTGTEVDADDPNEHWIFKHAREEPANGWETAAARRERERYRDSSSGGRSGSGGGGGGFSGGGSRGGGASGRW